MHVFEQILYFITIPWSIFFKKDKSIVSRIINDFLFQLIIPVKGNTTEFLHFFLFLFLLDKVLWATDSNPVDWLFLFNYPRKQIMIFGCRKTLVIQHHPHIRVFHIKDFYLTEVSLFKWERCSLIFCWKSSSKMQWYILHCFLNERTLDIIYWWLKLSLLTSLNCVVMHFCLF